jgi:hypothetical protein
MGDGLDVPTVTITELGDDVDDPPAATLPVLIGADALEFDPDTQLVRVPADLVEDGEPVRFVPDDLAEQLGHDG